MANCSMKKFAVIVAGGSGNRMGTAVPKQFLDLEGKPVIVHTAEAFLTAYPSIEMIGTTSKGSTMSSVMSYLARKSGLSCNALSDT